MDRCSGTSVMPLCRGAAVTGCDSFPGFSLLWCQAVLRAISCKALKGKEIEFANRLHSGRRRGQKSGDSGLRGALWFFATLGTCWHECQHGTQECVRHSTVCIRSMCFQSVTLRRLPLSSCAATRSGCTVAKDVRSTSTVFLQVSLA